MNIASIYPRLVRASVGAIPVVLLGLLSGCVTPPPRTYAVPAPPPQRLFVYPAHGQSPEQTERDRYECHNWAVQQTGVDPSRTMPMRTSAWSCSRHATRREYGRWRSCRGHHWFDYRRTAQRRRRLDIGRRDGSHVGSAADANAQKQAQ